LACAILQGSEVDGARGKVGRGGMEPPSGTVVAYRVFFLPVNFSVMGLDKS
jgi:hypothetical protein